MIRPEYRALGFYGRDWREYRAVLIALRGAWCRDCGRAVSSYINLSHETHDPKTSSIKIRCAGCHARADAPHRLAVVRRRRAVATGQLWLSSDIEWAAAPAWEIPARAIAGLQWKLFV